MMPLSLYFLFCHCAVILVWFDGIVCEIETMGFVTDNFSTADIYSKVVFEGPLNTGQFTLKKEQIPTRNSEFYEGPQQRILLISKILRHTMMQEQNDPTVVSFSVRGDYYEDYNIKFTTEGQAHHFVKYKAMPANYRISWARIYSNWRSIIIAYERWGNGDIGFKFLDNGNYPNPTERLNQLPFIFKRSEIECAIRTAPPQTLYMRNASRAKDYEIMFSSVDDLKTFLSFFPRRTYDDAMTMNYYFIRSPCPTP